jgi:FSR family fosmidomycin resistance protein-like MFS transporter
MGANVGDALAPLVIGTLLAVLDWRQVVVINVIPGVVMAVLILWLLRNLYITSSKDKSSKPSKEGIGFREYVSGLVPLLKNRNLLLISTSSGFRSMTQNALMTFLPLYLIYELSFSDALTGLSLALLQIAGLIAAPISGILSDRMGRKKIIMGSMTMTAITLVVMATVGQSKIFVLFIAVLGFFLYAIRPVMQAWLMDTTPKKMAGTSVGVLFGVQSMFSALSPLLAGLIADAYGLFSTFYFIAGTILAANLLIFFMPSPPSKDAEASVSA